MSLIDALLLDPYPFEVWIAFRADGLKGSGTLNDPYDGSTTAKFDARMSEVDGGTTVHLGPGIFTTAGYNDGAPTAGWQIQPGMKIIGSGFGATTLKLVDMSGSDRFYAIGHDLGAATSRDLCVVADLTIDCNLPGSGTVACGAVRLMGDHVRIRNVRAIHWGARAGGPACFVFAAISGDRISGNPVPTEPIDVGIEGCIADLPSANNGGTVNVFHMGGGSVAASDAEAFGKVPFIRDCYVDCGSLTTPFGHEIRALSMNWCKGGIVEGNQIQNVKIGGPYIENATCRDLIVRGNTYKNVKRGPWWKFGTPSASSLSVTLALPLSSPSTVAEATCANHPFAPGDRVQVSAASYPLYNGVFVVTEVPATDKFRYVMTARPGGTSSATAKKIYGGANLLIEKNVIELAIGSDGEIAIHLSDGKAEDPTPSTVLDTPDYDCLEAIIRENRIRYSDGKYGAEYTGGGIKVSGVKNVIVQNNVMEIDPVPPIQDFRCGTVYYSDNRNLPVPELGGLVPDADRFHPDLEVPAEEAFAFANLDK